MKTTILGQTGLTVSSTAFGCLPLQRASKGDAVKLLQQAYHGGITFFDTARAYSDSEEKIGIALSDVRDEIVISTKTTAQNATAFWKDLHTSLSKLKMDSIDIYQFHNPSYVPMPGGQDGLYDAALEAKAKGLIRHIGITQHSLALAQEAVRTGLYETMQYPFNHLASDEEIAFVETCKQENVGFICMKALSGGLITDAAIPFVFLRQYENAVPIWGFQYAWELEQLLSLEKNPPVLDDAIQARIADDRQSLVGSFCRSCGYCLPCPAGIPIHNANRMKQILTRMPPDQWLTPENQTDMERIADCTKCGLCEKRCPYGLKPYENLPDHLAFYRDFLQQRQKANA